MSSIVRQFVMTSVLLVVLQRSSAVRYSRSMRYAVPSIRNSIHQWKYVPFASLPRSMQRRFMWKDMDDTVDELMDGVASGARAMKHIFTPSMVRYRSPLDYDTKPPKVKYVIKKQPPPFKHMKVIKYRAPPKPIPIYNSAPLVEVSSEPPPVIQSLPKPSFKVPFISDEDLRKIEKEQEKRVENDSHSGIHEHSHQTHMDPDVVSGRINEFGEGWLPIQAPFSTQKSHPVSILHTKVETVVPPPSVPSPKAHPSMPTDNRSYEVTEHSAEESIQSEQAFQPSNHFEFLATTEVPNYPAYFLKNIQQTEDFKPKRVPIPIPTSPVSTTTTTSTYNQRLPPRSTTERPFKRYNLHRPKSSKLFFHRPTSSSESAITTEEAVRIIPEFLPTVEELIRTTRETIKTTREPIKTTREPIKTTREPIKTTKEPIRTTKAPTKAPPEKVRTTRNDSEVRSKLKNKKSSQSEGLNKVFIKNRGTVRFGEKQS